MRQSRPWVVLLLCIMAPCTATSGQSTSNEIAVVDNTPDLITVYKQAQAHSPDHRAALAEYRAAQEAGPQARGQLLPKLNASGGYSRVRQEVEGTILGLQDVEEDAYFDSSYYGVSLTQPLFDRKAFVGLEQADIKLKRSRLQLAHARNELRVKTATAYFGLLAAMDNLELARAEKKAISRQLDQTSDRFESGLTSNADVKAARAQYDRAKADVIAARNKVAVSQTKLEALTGERYEDVRALPEDAQLPPPQPNRMDPWVTQAVNNNIRLLTQTATAKLSELRIDKRRGQRWPELNLVGSYAYSDQDGGFFNQGSGASGAGGTTENTDARIGVRLTVPLYSGGLVSSRIREATERYNRAKAQQDQRRAEAIQNTRSAYLNVKKALAEINALEQAVKSAKSAEQSTRVGYDVGTSTSTEVLKAVRDRFRAKRDLAATRYDYLINSLKLKRAAGSLSNLDLKEINKRLR